MFINTETLPNVTRLALGSEGDHARAGKSSEYYLILIKYNPMSRLKENYFSVSLGELRCCMSAYLSHAGEVLFAISTSIFSWMLTGESYLGTLLKHLVYRRLKLKRLRYKEN